MRTVNINEAKDHRSRLVERAANGEPFIIAKARQAAWSRWFHCDAVTDGKPSRIGS